MPKTTATCGKPKVPSWRMSAKKLSTTPVAYRHSTHKRAVVGCFLSRSQMRSTQPRAMVDSVAQRSHAMHLRGLKYQRRNLSYLFGEDSTCKWRRYSRIVRHDLQSNLLHSFLCPKVTGPHLNVGDSGIFASTAEDRLRIYEYEYPHVKQINIEGLFNGH